MNNQSVRASWKLIEDFPQKDGIYLVSYEDSNGEFLIENSEIWSFSHGEWAPFQDTHAEASPSIAYSLPSYYIDLPMPKL